MSAEPRSQHKAYIIGTGVAGLAAAVYLIRDAGFNGNNITLFEQDAVNGGALDGSGSADKGYLIRGGRMHEEHYVCTWDLLSQIPSLTDPTRSVTEETFDFNKSVVTCSHSRLLRDGKKINVSSYGLSKRDTFDLLRLNTTAERLLGNRTIEEWFAPEFFDTVFWHLWATTFAFQRWSSLAEMRRYAIRFIHLLPGFNQLIGIMRTVYNQYDSVVLPLEAWLLEHGVNFIRNTPVTDIDFALDTKNKRANSIHYLSANGAGSVALGEHDYLFVTLGSMMESASVGTMHTAAPLLPKGHTGAWALWEKIAARDDSFGHPGVFCDHVDRSKWVSFTVTLKDPTFFDHMERFTGNKAGTGGLVTFTDSSWYMSVVLAHQPHFANQPPDTFVFWGDGLLPDNSGDFVKKPMSQCSGEEILAELFHHLGIVELMAPLMDKIICIPCMMPYIDAQFLPRTHGDRPQVIPSGAQNYAFLGQFVEVPRDCVFTVEYSVRTAQTAVFGLFDTGRKANPIYRGDHNLHVLIDALNAMAR